MDWADRDSGDTPPRSSNRQGPGALVLTVGAYLHHYRTNKYMTHQ